MGAKVIDSEKDPGLMQWVDAEVIPTNCKMVSLRFLILVLNLITINIKHLYAHENAYEF